MGLKPILRYEGYDMVDFVCQNFRNIVGPGRIGYEKPFNEIKNQNAEGGERND